MQNYEVPEPIINTPFDEPGDVGVAIELKLVNRIRERVKAWREQGYPGVTRTTHELLEHWRRDGREVRLFFAQREAAETVIFLTEARADFHKASRFRATNRATTRRPKATPASLATPARWRRARARRPSWQCSPRGAS